MDINGANVVVTGAGRGLGLALAKRFAAGGANVVLSDIDEAAVVAAAEEVGGRAVHADIGSADGVRQVIERAEELIGDIDIYFSNAAYSDAYRGAIDRRIEQFQSECAPLT